VGLSCGRTVCVVEELGLSNFWGIGVGGRVGGGVSSATFEEIGVLLFWPGIQRVFAGHGIGFAILGWVFGFSCYWDKI